LQQDSSNRQGSGRTTGNLRRRRALRLLALALFLFALLLPASPAKAGQSSGSRPEFVLPATPQPQLPLRSKTTAAEPCHLKRDGTAVVAAAAAGAMASDPANPVLDRSLQPAPCPPLEPLINWYQRFTNGPQVKPMTPREKGWLAIRNLADPFNAITILGEAGISVAANSHSPYGPGMPGYGRYVGVSFTQDMTGEFFGTFLIPSIFRQDPHYHRLPNATIQRRIAHAIIQVLWTQGDNGKGIVNYADLVGFAIDDQIGNLYVPGQQTNLAASAERYGIDLATAPIENFITEFVPDVARRIHVRVVLVQRIVNQVGRTQGSGQ
jgi:hypothetical protein